MVPPPPSARAVVDAATGHFVEGLLATGFGAGAGAGVFLATGFGIAPVVRAGAAGNDGAIPAVGEGLRAAPCETGLAGARGGVIVRLFCALRDADLLLAELRTVVGAPAFFATIFFTSAFFASVILRDTFGANVRFAVDLCAACFVAIGSFFAAVFFAVALTTVRLEAAAFFAAGRFALDVLDAALLRPLFEGGVARFAAGLTFRTIAMARSLG